MTMDLMYKIRKEKIEEMTKQEQTNEIKKLAIRTHEYLEEIRTQIKDIFKSDLEKLPLELLLQVENESLFLTVTLNKITYLIQERLKQEENSP